MPRRKIIVKPVLSAFVCGVLVALGVDPGQMLFDAAVSAFAIYLRFIAAVVLIVAIYLSHSWVLEAAKRSKPAYRKVGALEVMSVLLAFFAGFLVFQWERAAMALLAAANLWVWAQLG